METETESKEEQCKNSTSSSSRSSSITSDSSEGHFDIRHFPLPKPSLSASEAQKQRDAYNNNFSSVSSSYTGSSWSSVHQIDLPGYDPSRIPSSVFSSKPASSADWSIASNESLFSIHDANFSISTREDLGLRLSDIPRFEDTVHEIPEINRVPLPLPLPPVKKPNESEKEPYQVEISNSEIDDNEEDDDDEMIDHESDEEEDVIQVEVMVETETENQEEKVVVVEEDVKEKKPEDSNSATSHSPSISCRSDTSNNSIGSFAFPVLQKEDGVVKTPSLEIKGNVSHRPEYQLPQPLMQPPQPQPQLNSESSTNPHLHHSGSQPQRKSSKQFESQTQSLKASRNRWFSCFHCPLKCGLFK